MSSRPLPFVNSYSVTSLPSGYKDWVLNRKNHRNVGAESLAKPLRDGNLVSLMVLYNWRQKGERFVPYKAGLGGTRRVSKGNEQLIQLPMDAWSIKSKYIVGARRMQLAENLKLTDIPIGSFSCAGCHADALAHKNLSFEFLDEIGHEHVLEFFEYTQRENVLPWVRSSKRGLRFKDPKRFSETLKRVAHNVSRITMSGSIAMHRSWKFSWGNNPADKDAR